MVSITYHLSMKSDHLRHVKWVSQLRAKHSFKHWIWYIELIHNVLAQSLTHRFWQDNDPKHTSRRAKVFMEENNINWFKTPAESPDLNPIENVWATLKHYVAKDMPRTQQDLVDSIVKFWDSHLPVEQCNRYIDHVYNVIPKVILAKGDFSGCWVYYYSCELKQMAKAHKMT